MVETLSTLAAALLSVLFSYVPGLRTWYAGLEDAEKKLLMLGLLAASALGAFGVSCAGLWPIVTCDQPGAMELIRGFIIAVAVNQSVHKISPITDDVAEAKAARG